MEHARATWTDERLDDLSRRMDNGFSRLDQDLRSVNVRIDALEGRIDGRFDALQRIILQVGGGMIATFLIGFASLIATRF
jgi:hypothetical protein